MFPFAACPDICPSHEAIKQMNPDLKDITPRHIDIYLYSQEARSPRLLFCWPILAGWRVATRQRRIGSPASEHQQSQPSAP